MALQQTKINYVVLGPMVKKIMAAALIGSSVKKIVVNTVKTVPVKEEPIKIIVPVSTLYVKIFLQYFSASDSLYNHLALSRLIGHDLYLFLALILYLYSIGKISIWLLYRLLNLIKLLQEYYQRTKNFSASEWQQESRNLKVSLKEYVNFKIQIIKSYLRKNYKKLFVYAFIIGLSIYLFVNRKTLIIFKPVRRYLRRLRRHLSKGDVYYLHEL